MEIGRHVGTNFTTHWGKTIALKDLTAWDLPPNDRLWIQDDDTTGGTEGWFRFDSCETYDEYLLVVATAAGQKLLKKITHPGSAEPLLQEEKLTLRQRFKKLLWSQW